MARTATTSTPTGLSGPRPANSAQRIAKAHQTVRWAAGAPDRNSDRRMTEQGLFDYIRELLAEVDDQQAGGPQYTEREKAGGIISKAPVGAMPPRCRCLRPYLRQAGRETRSDHPRLVALTWQRAVGVSDGGFENERWTTAARSTAELYGLPGCRGGRRFGGEFFQDDGCTPTDGGIESLRSLLTAGMGAVVVKFPDSPKGLEADNHITVAQQ